MSSPEADLTGWVAAPFAAAGQRHDVYRKGKGPGVVLLPELPGLHPGVLALGNHLVQHGFTVAAPSLFGTPGAAATRPAMAAVLARLCVSSEFAALVTNAKRPVADYLRALAREVNATTPGPGVGVIGQCVTGGFALAAAVDDSVLAPVLSQPSAPLPFAPSQRRDPGLSEAELAVVRRRATNEGLCALGLRFSADYHSPAARFATLRARLGDSFQVIEIDSSHNNPHGLSRRAHSVLTLEMRETEGHPTNEARKQVVDFLNDRLK